MNVSIVGGSGYAGGELLRLLLAHPHAEVQQVTSQRYAGRAVHKAHPNLRGTTETRFCTIEELEPCDLLLVCLPHGRSMENMDGLMNLADRIIDLSGDFRLRDQTAYESTYGHRHERPDLLQKFVYGIPELHRREMADAKLVSSAGCNATATVLALHPLFEKGLVERAVIEVKVGSSEGGASASDASHHPERSGCVRSYRPTGHRHIAEIKQELGTDEIYFSATTIEMVRGILATCHVFLREDISERDAWRIYRAAYGQEPFVRIVTERTGIHRYPEPKLIAGSNFCDIGFSRDEGTNRLVVVSAIDNLMKGAAGQAVQAYNIMNGLPERTGLEFPGLHPI